LHELLPEASRLAVLATAKDAQLEFFTRNLQSKLRLKIEVFTADSERDISPVFAIIAEKRIQALLVGSEPLFSSHRMQLVALATYNKLPAIYGWREAVDAGGLMSYGANVADEYRQIGNYTGRILEGERPADLPVLQPTKFELSINLKTAKALGLSIPETLLATADEVIQ
jgi:putative tryptophan/tyrosine transport system substrate-binding protein